ncbi:hypothetical protein JTB14_021373 [Gonioctena quinquepunctata]|nr:hypothetical protein JTB14_021373 [Gonioctena quinquepunctata]
MIDIELIAITKLLRTRWDALPSSQEAKTPTVEKSKCSHDTGLEMRLAWDLAPDLDPVFRMQTNLSNFDFMASSSGGQATCLMIFMVSISCSKIKVNATPLFYSEMLRKFAVAYLVP